MAITLVQQQVGSGTGTGFTVTLGADPAAGSTLVLIGMDELHTGVSVSGGGATWAEVPNFQGGNYGLTAWVGTNCSGAGGLNVITYSGTSTGNQRLANVSEWTGLDTTTPLDQSPAGTSTATATPTTVAITPAAADGVVFGAVDWINAATIGAAGSSFTNLTQATAATNRKAQAAYLIHASAAAYNTSWTLSGSTDTDVISFNLLGAASPPLSTTPRLDAKWFDFAERGQTWTHFWQDTASTSTLVARTLTESVTQSDAWGRSTGAVRSLTGAVTSSDVWTRTGTFIRALAGAVTSSDVWTRFLTFPRTMAESVTSTDAWTRSGTFIRALAGAVASGDAWGRVVSAGRSTAESVASSDVWTRSGTFIRALTEGVTSADAWVGTKLGAIVRTMAESVTSSDAWTRSGTFARSLTESVASGDAWSRVATSVRTMTDSVTQSDAWTRSGTFIRAMSEAVQSADTWVGTKLGAIVRAMTESVTSSDAWDRSGTFARTLTDAVQSADTWAGALVAHITGGLAPVGRAISSVVSAIASHIKPDGGASGPTPGGESSSPTPEH